MNWMDLSLRDFQAAIASSSPTPGGGTAAAVALGQAASLAVMVSDLTIGKEKWRSGWKHAEITRSVATPMMDAAGVLATDDSEAFDDEESNAGSDHQESQDNEVFIETKPN